MNEESVLIIVYSKHMGLEAADFIISS